MSAHVRLTLLTALLAAAPAVGLDPIDRRSRDEPEVCPKAEDGRAGACDVLRFSPAGDVLFAAGDDKVVTGWPHAAGGLDTDPARTRVLRWPAWREQRGGIKDLAVSPDGTRVLVGGYGLRSSEVAILDRDPPALGLPAVQLTWPLVTKGAGGTKNVQAVAFAADGKAVAFGTHDGSVWLWTPEELTKADDVGRWYNPPLWVGGRPAAKDRGPDFARLVFFRAADQKLVAVSRFGAVTEYDVSDPKKLTAEKGKVTANAKDHPPLFDAKSTDAVFHAALDAPRGRLVIACENTPRVLLRGWDQPAAAELALPKGHFARTVAVHPKTGAVAVAVGSVVAAKASDPQFHNDADDTVSVYREPTAKATPDLTIRPAGQAEALAFHPTLDRLAVAGGDASEVRLYDLTRGPGVAFAVFSAAATPDPAAARLDRSAPVSVARGKGRKPWQLALATDGTAVGLKTRRDPAVATPNGRGAGDWAWMDLTRLFPVSDEPKEWVSAVTAADGWTVEPDPKNRDRWFAVRGGRRVALTYNTDYFNKPTCYTFLPAAAGKPTRLVVGHYYGASLYELPAVGADVPAELAVARVYIGHAGEVLAVAALDDDKGGWFVTGGADHTVAAFHLAGWASHPHLGAKVEPVEGRLRVTAVDVGSPGWEAGLQPGDEVRFLAHGGHLVYDPTKPDVAAPAAARAALAAAPPGVELYFGLTGKGGGRRETLTTVRQRPLWKLFTALTADDRLSDWVITAWKGSYYHTLSPRGDRMVGWQLNGPTTRFAPRFHELGRFPAYQKPDVIRRLLDTRDLKAALGPVLGANPLPPAFGDREPAPIQIDTRNEIGGGDVTVTVRVARRGSDVDLLPDKVELWVNDFRYGTWTPEPGQDFTKTLTLDRALFRSDDKAVVPVGDNTLTVQTSNPAGGRAVERRWLTNTNPSPGSNLLGLAVGVNDYQAQRAAGGARGGLGNLSYAVADATAVAGRFGEFVGPRLAYRAGRLDLKTDAAVTPAALLDTLKRVTAKPDDVLVLFLAGHGQLVGERNGATQVIADTVADPEKEFANVRFAFCCPGVDPTRPGAEFVTAERLFDALAGLNCRKVILLDVCRAGWATKRDVLRQFVPVEQGPVVIAACGPGQESFESPALKHGLFTAAVLDATGDQFHLADRDQDGRVSCRELFEYVERRVADTRRPGGRPQTPICFPDPGRLPKTAVVGFAAK